MWSVPWLGSDLAALRYFMYFRFCELRYEPYGGVSIPQQCRAWVITLLLYDYDCILS